MNLLKVCKGVHHETRFCLSVLFLAGSLFSTVLIVNNMPNTDDVPTLSFQRRLESSSFESAYIGQDK